MENTKSRAKDELSSALEDFMGAFEVVFRYDWEYTGAMIDPDVPSFLEPGVEDESEDWASRGALLETYRNLVEVMKRHGLAPKLPFPLENLPGAPKVLW